MDKISFYKMSASGNDFILIDNRDRQLPKLDITSFVQEVCRRRFSVGADGLILIEQSNKAHFKWSFFNADGGEVEMCGNGARCVAKLAHLLKIAPSPLSFETQAGIIRAEITPGGVKVRMTDPYDLRPGIRLNLSNQSIEGGYINTGVPHLVCLVEDLENYPVVDIGRQIRFHPDFSPSGTNANFVTLRGSNKIKVRTYERGVEDETMACGTGAIASALMVAVWKGMSSPVAVETRGGEVLAISFRHTEQGFSEVYLEGRARIIYQGYLWPEAFKRE
jgi:diaminopimelate epimerase